MRMLLSDVARRLTGAMLPGPLGDRVIERVRTDSREVTPGDLFFCLKGERFDAHDFAAQVAAAGAAAIVAQQPVPGVDATASPVLLVPDTQKALGLLARAWRDMVRARVVAVTGTAGKTTAKELLAQTLGSVFKVAKNHKNFNNQVGLPLSMLAAGGREDVWVMEAGISQPHDMAELGEIVSPDLALVLNIGPAHLEGLGDLSGVAKAKASLLSHLKADGQGLCSMDYPELWAEAKRILPGVHGFSARDENARYFARFLSALPGGRGRYEIRVDGASIEAELPACGTHFAENAAAVAGACFLLGLTPAQIAAGLAKAELPGQRFCTFDAGGWRIVDDTYNANPLSMRRSIEAARLMAGSGKLVLVLGDMKELGPGAASAHEELGRAVADTAPELVFFQGDYAADFARGLSRPVTSVTEPGGVLSALKGQEPGVVLVKGSRSCRMELYARALTEGLGQAEGGKP